MPNVPASAPMDRVSRRRIDEFRADLDLATAAIAAEVTRASEADEGFVDRLGAIETDDRWADSRTPTVHKESHAAGGTDVLSPADIGAAGASSRAVPPGWFIGPEGPMRTAFLLSAGVGVRLGIWHEIKSETQRVDLMRWEVTVGGDGAAAIQTALYRLRQPASLTVDRVAITGAIDAVTPVVKDAAITPVDLLRGYYLTVMETTGAVATRPTIRVVQGSSGVHSSDVSELLDPRPGVAGAALVNAAGLPASFALVPVAARVNGPVVLLRTA